MTRRQTSTRGCFLACHVLIKQKREGEQLKAQSEHLKMQATELNEAARLEQEAGMRRQRAVGLGADPVLASGTNGFSPANPHARR